MMATVLLALTPKVAKSRSALVAVNLGIF